MGNADPMTCKKFGCVIMASGLGKRFGGGKLMAEFLGEPLISGILTATEGLFARRIVVTRQEDLGAYCRERGAEVLLHSLPHRNDTVGLGLSQLLEMDGCMFCPGDQPLLSRETVEALVEAGRRAPEYIWQPAWKGESGAPVLFPSWSYGELLALPEGKGGSWLVKQHPERVRTVPVGAEYELWDADTPEELEGLRKLALGMLPAEE